MAIEAFISNIEYVKVKANRNNGVDEMTKNMSVREAITTRRSIKQFNGQLVAKEDIVSIIEDAVWAPNHGNREPWRLIVATGEQLPLVFEKIRNVAVPNWATLSEEDLAKQMAKFTTAGAYVFVVMPEDRRQKERLEDFAAASSLLQNMQLLAWDKGIGSCWKTPPFLENAAFNDSLQVQAGERIIAMLQLGYFDEAPKGKARKSVQQIVTFLGE